MKKITGKDSISYTYNAKVYDISTYDKVRDYIIRFESLDHYRSNKVIDKNNNQDYVDIYVEYTDQIGLNPDKMHGDSFSKRRRITYNKIKSVFNGRKILDTIINESLEPESKLEPKEDK